MIDAHWIANLADEMHPPSSIDSKSIKCLPMQIPKDVLWHLLKSGGNDKAVRRPPR
jgi:hypothetical protein